MGVLSPKLRSIEWKGNPGITFWCPGCEGPHAVHVEGPGAWQWDGNVDEPTISPSIRTFTNMDENGNRLPDGQTRTLCHSFVRDGQIQFLGDSGHNLVGLTVPIPDWPTGAE